MSHIWNWQNFEVSWQGTGLDKKAPFAILFIHGFGACKEHWRQNTSVLGEFVPCYSIDLIGFGNSSQPPARLDTEVQSNLNFSYKFDNWAQQIADFSNEIIKKPVILIGNSIGGIVALCASKLIKENCISLVLINCAQRTMDDKRVKTQSISSKALRSFLKYVTKKKWLSRTLFINCTRISFIKGVLKKAYPSGKNITNELIDLLIRPSKRKGAHEPFHGFINNFNDHLATDLMMDNLVPIHLIWGEDDPWESIKEAQLWFQSFECIHSLKVIKKAGHCPHDEAPEEVNSILLNIIQEAI